jgi:glycosyltransferase involved in cell wall biosynthesis
MDSNKKQKIAIFSTFYPFRGGIAQFSSSLYRSLEKKSVIKAFTFKRQYPNFLFPGKTQFVTEKDNADKIDSVRILDSINPLTYFKTAKQINKTIPDIYISNYWMSFFGPALGIVSRFLNKKAKQIAVIHNAIPHEKKFFDTPFTKFFLKKTDGFVVMSDAVLNDLLKLKPDAKYIRIDHPVYNHFGEKTNQLKALEKLKLDPTKKTLLFFGFIRSYKGLDVLLKSFEKLDDSYQLIIAGEIYGSFENYQQLINENPNKHNIHLFTDYIDDKDVTFYFSAADVCILPYKSATQSGITAISNHFTLPVIATDVGGLKETVKHLKTGLIVDKVDPEHLKLAIEEYFNQNLKEQFTKAISEENALNSWDNFAEKLIEFSKTIDK